MSGEIQMSFSKNEGLFRSNTDERPVPIEDLKKIIKFAMQTMSMDYLIVFMDTLSAADPAGFYTALMSIDFPSSEPTNPGPKFR
jgi:hypothetical protein